MFYGTGTFSVSSVFYSREIRFLFAFNLKPLQECMVTPSTFVLRQWWCECRYVSWSQRSSFLQTCSRWRKNRVDRSASCSRNLHSKARFPLKRTQRKRVRCMRCVNEKRKQRKRLRWQLWLTASIEHSYWLALAFVAWKIESVLSLRFLSQGPLASVAWLALAYFCFFFLLA